MVIRHTRSISLVVVGSAARRLMTVRAIRLSAVGGARRMSAQPVLERRLDHARDGNMHAVRGEKVALDLFDQACTVGGEASGAPAARDWGPG